jgi:hypothetical protein
MAEIGGNLTIPSGETLTEDDLHESKLTFMVVGTGLKKLDSQNPLSVAILP